MTELARDDRPVRSLLVKGIHWGFVLLYAYAIYKGLESVNQLADRALLNFELVFATVFLAVTAARFFLMRRYFTSALANDTPKVIKWAAHYGHYAIYAAVSLIAISGIIVGLLYRFGVEAGLIMEATIALHEIAVTGSYVIIGGHVAAALMHRVLGDGVWGAMVPLWRG